jgi:hypothetical protein
MDAGSLRSTAKVVPWATWAEWRRVKNGLCNYVPNCAETLEAASEALRIVRFFVCFFVLFCAFCAFFFFFCFFSRFGFVLNKKKTINT